MNLKNISKYLSYILRHHPEEIQITLDEFGYADVNSILSKLNITLDDLKQIVETNNKKRFSFNFDLSKIRAVQGHSIPNINLNLESVKPTHKLYHGTNLKAFQTIKYEGLKKMSRHAVHLSKDIETAITVGKRGNNIYLVILEIDAIKMSEDGFEFFISENGVYLTDSVPEKYIKLII